MSGRVDRRTVDLSAYPDLVVIYLGMRVNSLRGLFTLIGFGPRIARAVKAKPDGLLLHEDLIFGLMPPHFGMRQYWRDFDALERWARSDAHREWWKSFLRDSRGVGFWHETYLLRGGAESVYDDMRKDVGFLRFATTLPARGSLFSARQRAGRPGDETAAIPIPEEELYDTPS